MDLRRFHKRLSDAAQPLLPRGSGVLCAVSGGADSMALLHGLQEVNRIRRCDWHLHVAHLDHALRPESAADAAFVQHAAHQLDLPCTVRRVEVPAARASGESIEEAARRVRYAFLEEAAMEMVAGGDESHVLVAVGHHADDQAETVLHHIIRGTGLRGLAGMPARRPICWNSRIDLVRPLLGFRRTELRAYLEQRRLPYRTDATNADGTAARRNLIRHQVLPLIETAVNPEAVTALLRLAEQARRAQDVVAFCTGEALERAVVRQNRAEIVLNARLVSALPKAIQAEIILEVLRRLHAPLQEVGFERIEAAAEAAGGAGRRVIELPGSVTIQRHRGELVVRQEC